MSFPRFVLFAIFAFIAESVASPQAQESNPHSGDNHSRSRNWQRGFSLVELLIVVVIIVIIAALAVPSFMRSRMTAYEASAVGSMRMINTSAMTYASTYPDQGFPPSLAALSGAMPCTPTSATACLIDQLLASGTKSGYTFVWTGDGNTPSVAYTLTGTPIVVGATGQRMFCSDQSGVIHFDPSGAGCTNASAPLQ
jgi:prepilin-type N-terminal cleavage/methylation domain-containing protein